MTVPPSTETRHTATLWVADEHQVFDLSGERIAVCNGHVTPSDEAQYARWKADAALIVTACNSHAALTARVAELEANERAYETTLGRRTYNEVALYIDSLKEAITDLIEAIRRDSDDDGKGISGYTAARVSDAKAALSQTEEGRS